jgi:hypothetical protein
VGIVTEALKGISFLAVDDQLRIGIVEGPLRSIIKIMVDPEHNSEIKKLSEQIIVNIGFLNGRQDLEVVAHDYVLFADWFYMRRSLRPQSLAGDLLAHWIDVIFRGKDIAEKRIRQHFLLSELSLEREFDQSVNDGESLFLDLPGTH